MKNFSIMAISWKIQFLWGAMGVHEKLVYREELPKKGLIDQFTDLRGGLDGGQCFLGGGWYPNAHCSAAYRLC